MYTHIGVHLTGGITVRDAETDAGDLYVSIDGENVTEPHLTLWIPTRDDDAELAISLLQAAIDNASSRIAARRRRREIEASGEQIVGFVGVVRGWDGAGSNVNGTDLEVGRG